MTRNFYGTLRVKEYDRGDGPNTSRALVHGVINHGWQYTDPDLRKEPISYFGPSSGIARALDFYEGRPRRVGIIGLGVGSFTAWGRPGDYFRVYELDPDVVKIAREQFWYLSDAKAKIDVVTGDGRLSMERDEPQKFDLISVDAFSSGSIPIHLLTREALQAYKRHLAPGGVIVYNVTNRFVNLAPQLKLVAEAEGMKIVLIDDSPDDNKYSGTSYVLVTQNEQLLADKRFADRRRHRAHQGPRDLDRQLQQPVQGRALTSGRLSGRSSSAPSRWATSAQARICQPEARRLRRGSGRRWECRTRAPR